MRRGEHELKRKALEMRNAIDMIEGALFGAGDLADLPALFVETGDDVVVTPHMTVAELKRIGKALDECNRIMNADEFNPDQL